MTSAVVFSSNGSAAPPLVDDLEAVGFRVLDLLDCTNMLHDVISRAPDLIICFENAPDAAFFTSLAAIGATAPLPVAVFTNDPDAEKIALATSSGVHAYVVAAYSRNRLRSVVHLAQARFRQDQLLRKELAEIRQRFDERKLVDRAKGILMGARQLREEEAFRVLRSAAMASKQRIGQISQLVIDSARYAEAMNRAGQLRMLSQRLVKFYALTCAGVAQAETKGLYADSIAQVDANLAILTRSLSLPTFGDLLHAVQGPWERLRDVLRTSSEVRRLREVDGLAEALLEHAERLTENLEIAAFATALHVINVAGRQRMLSQRLAKEALMSTLLSRDGAAALRRSSEVTAAELVQGLDYLIALPLSNAEIKRELEQTVQVWEIFGLALAACGTPAGREQVAALSETLLGHFDRLTDQLERSMQALVK